MKRGIIFFIFAVFFADIIAVSAMSFDMNTNLSQGQTLIAKVSGNFLEPVTASDIYLYRDGYIRIPVQFYLQKFGEDYYMYSDLSGKTPGSYSLEIKNVKHTEQASVTTADIIQNFTINQNFASFSVSPGFVSANSDFSISIKNLGDNDMDVAYSVNQNSSSDFFSIFSNSSQNSISVPASQTKTAYFSLSSFADGLNLLQLSAGDTQYNIPVFASLPSRNASQNQAGNAGFQFNPGSLNISVSVGNNSTRVISLANTGQVALKDISLSLSSSLVPYMNLSVSSINEIGINSATTIAVIIYPQPQKLGVQGTIKAGINSLSLVSYASVSLNYLENYSSSEEQSQFPADCNSVQNGKDCKGKACTGITIDSRAGKCCIGECASGTGSGTIVIIIIVVLVLAGGVVFFLMKGRKGLKKLKKQSPSGSSEGTQLLLERKK